MVIVFCKHLEGLAEFLVSIYLGNMHLSGMGVFGKYVSLAVVTGVVLVVYIVVLPLQTSDEGESL
jgi:hypothetical protein